ncbi:MAG: hypothetical protein JXQ83_06945 [Candidatus Glassbacteria bacterium]|nr:hypothetical protein [Candidatus Glassbacteria bacterium]
MVSYFKCSSMTNRLHDLNKEGRKEDKKEEPHQETTQPQDTGSPEE